MFHRWGFLLGEIWGLLVLAALLGLAAGWVIWARRPAPQPDTAELDRLRTALETCSTRGQEAKARIAALEGDLARAQDLRAAERAAAQVGAAQAAAAAPAPLAAMAPPVAPAVAPAAPPPADAPPAPVDGARPQGLTAARDGRADDLKLIKGIGPKLEALCHRLGFFHFDQIANWTAAEVAWVDENLEGFKGRVTRDEWVAQARDLAAGKPPRPGAAG